MQADQLDLNLLRALHALLAERHVTRAAARLHRTQPATSAALARLRAAFNDPLLVRGAHGMVPTARALQLAPIAAALLQQIGDMVAPLRFDPATPRRMTLETTDYVQALLAPWLATLPEHAPGIDLALVAADSARTVARMERGEVDVAVLNLARAPQQLHARTVLTDEFVVVGRRTHPRLARRLSLDAFCALEHVLISPRNASFSGATDEALAALGRRRRVRVSLHSFLAVAELVASSDLIAMFPARLARHYAYSLRAVAPPVAIPGFALAVAWHEQQHRDGGNRWLREEIAKALGSEAPRAPRGPRTSRATGAPQPSRVRRLGGAVVARVPDQAAPSPAPVTRSAARRR